MNYNYHDSPGFSRNKYPYVFMDDIYAEKNVHIDEFQVFRDALLSYDEISHADLWFPVSGLGE